MFQSEVAKRLTASPGNKTYGAMSVLVQYYARPSFMLEVSRKSFFPVPKVDSMVLELDFERPYPKTTIYEDVFRKVVKGAFAHRRKKMINSLKAFFTSPGPEVFLETLEICGIDPARRAETLDMEEFLCLTDTLSLTKNQLSVK